MRRPQQAMQSAVRAALSPNKVNPSSNAQKVLEDFLRLLPKAKPKPDQMQVSLFTRLHPDEVKSMVSDALGEEPQKTQDNSYWNYSQSGIRLSCGNTYFHHVIRFNAPSLLPVIANIVSIFPPKSNGKPAAQLFELEIRFDIPVPKLAESARLQLLDSVAAVTVLKNPKADIRAIGRNNSCNKTKDRALNGPRTWYFEPYARVPCDEKRPDQNPWQPVPTAKLIGKIYLKKLHSGNWVMRFEVTIRSSSLKARIGTLDLPETVAELYSRINGMTISNFWKFEIFDGISFAREAEAIVDSRRNQMTAGQYMYSKMLLNMMLYKAHQSAMRQRFIALRLARALNSDRLKQLIYKGKFTTRLL